jgi:type II secretory pathway pseudopilin PulG
MYKSAAQALKGRRAGVTGRIAAGQSGTTLIELLMVSALLAVVLGAILGLLDNSSRQAPKDQERAHAIADVQVGLDRMVRELRQAYQLRSFDAVKIDADAKIQGRDRRLVYQCDVPHPTRANTRRCVRYEIATDGSQTPQEVVIDRVLNGTAANPVFTYPPGSPLAHYYVAVKMEVPAAGDLAEGFQHKVVLDDGFYLRNLSGR